MDEPWVAEAMTPPAGPRVVPDPVCSMSLIVGFCVAVAAAAVAGLFVAATRVLNRFIT